MTRLSPKRLQEAEDLLELSRVAQTEYWQSLTSLEACLHIEIDSTIDLSNADLEILLRPVQ
jgi:hypothetical protein